MQWSEEYCPSQEYCKFSDEIKHEMVKSPLHITLAMLSNVCCITHSSIDKVVERTNFSTACYQLIVTVYVLRFMKQLNGRCTEHNPMNPIILHSSEITEAELTRIRVILRNQLYCLTVVTLWS